MDLTEFIGVIELNNVENVEFALKNLEEKEVEIKNDIQLLLLKQCAVEAKLATFNHSKVILDNANKEAEKLNAQILTSVELANSVKAKVRRLDLARSRASECQQRVHDLIDLQLCSQGVLTAIKEEDYETGANHIGRFLAMDQQLLQRTADDVQGSVTSVSVAVRTLEEATSKMRDLVLKRFDEAVNKDDLAAVERFFKLFPLLGRHGQGIERFASYICKKLSVKAQKELRNSLDLAKSEKRLPLAYADTLTSLLENFARVVEVNQPIIETCFGYGWILPMMEILQRQCDVEVKNLLLELQKQRQIHRRIQQINETQRSNATGGVGGAVAGIQSLGHYRKASGGSIDKLNPKEIDSLIAEITVLHSRAELYIRYMKRRIQADISADQTVTESEKKEKLKNLDKLFQQSDLSRQMQELLSTYLLFEKYFMEESVLKAIAMDAYEADEQCSSMVDDVFFILRKCIRRSMTTQSINGICAVINNAASCLDGDYLNALKTPLKNGYPSGYIDLAQAYNAIQTTLQQGKLQANDSEKARQNFLVQLNNADMSTEYIETLWQTMQQEIEGAFPKISTVEWQIVEICMSELKTVRDSFKACVDFGMQQLRSSAIKPRLNPWVDQFLNYNHYLTEDELASYEAGETFSQFLIVQLDGLLNSFKHALTSRNYDALVSILANEVTSRLERAIKKSNFNRLGGLVLDQEVRALGSYLTAATSWSVRDNMTRLTQIATLLNLEKVSELTDYWHPQNASDMPSWRLTPNEVRTILTLRNDFRMEDIKRIQL